MQEELKMMSVKLLSILIDSARRFVLMLRLLMIWNFGARIVLFRPKVGIAW